MSPESGNQLPLSVEPVPDHVAIDILYCAQTAYFTWLAYFKCSSSQLRNTANIYATGKKTEQFEHVMLPQ